MKQETLEFPEIQRTILFLQKIKLRIKSMKALFDAIPMTHDYM